MKVFFKIVACFICVHLYAQDEISADWNVSVTGDEVTISIVEFNNFTVGLDGHWHYILNEEEYVAVHDINDVIISGLQEGEHSLYLWLVDHMHNPLNPPVEETITFAVNTGLSISDNEVLYMMVYPNPVIDNYVNIQSNLDGLKKIQVFTLTGRKVIDTTINGNTLDVNSLNSGFYILKVTINGKSKVSKLMIR